MIISPTLPCKASQGKKDVRPSSPRSLCHFETQQQQGFRQNLLERPQSLRHRNWPNRKSIFLTCRTNFLFALVTVRVYFDHTQPKPWRGPFWKPEPDSVCKTSLFTHCAPELGGWRQDTTSVPLQTISPCNIQQLVSSTCTSKGVKPCSLSL